MKEDKLPTKTGFAEPKGYFDSLEKKILNKVKPSKVISIKTTILSSIPYAAAASVLLFIGINYFSTFKNTPTFDELTAVEIENWLETDFDSSNEVVAIMQEVDFYEVDFTNTIEQQEIEEYLYNIDTDVLLNEIN